ncbi:MAG: hypothetical protein KAR35_01915 [Candidatus Heimdallarchaeota archaeon]|nr:hypothetical protein [Candidatus Heimdallarchaeota archaeon]MCK5048109.1 hypothetical protein [Candidatus Heimdallarchaeota archaeon]
MSRTKDHQIESVLKTWGNIEADVTIEDHYGRRKTVPWVISSRFGKFAVWFYDWRKSLGTDRVIRTEKIIEGTVIDGAILIGHSFSDQAENIAQTLMLSEKAKPVFLIEFKKLKEIPIIGIQKLMQRMVVMRAEESVNSFEESFLTEISKRELEEVFDQEQSSDIISQTNEELFDVITPSRDFFDNIN